MNEYEMTDCTKCKKQPKLKQKQFRIAALGLMGHVQCDGCGNTTGYFKNPKHAIRSWNECQPQIRENVDG